MASHKLPRHLEIDRFEQYSPREIDPATSRSQRIDDKLLESHASLFPKIFNSFITKSELNESMLFKKPLVEIIGNVKSIKLL